MCMCSVRCISPAKHKHIAPYRILDLCSVALFLLSFIQYFGFGFCHVMNSFIMNFIEADVCGHAKTVTNGLDRLFKIATTLSEDK